MCPSVLLRSVCNSGRASVAAELGDEGRKLAFAPNLVVQNRVYCRGIQIRRPAAAEPASGCPSGEHKACGNHICPALPTTRPGLSGAPPPSPAVAGQPARRSSATEALTLQEPCGELASHRDVGEPAWGEKRAIRAQTRLSAATIPFTVA